LRWKGEFFSFTDFFHGGIEEELGFFGEVEKVAERVYVFYGL
jgi:hypothetical protein